MIKQYRHICLHIFVFILSNRNNPIYQPLRSDRI